MSSFTIEAEEYLTRMEAACALPEVVNDYRQRFAELKEMIEKEAPHHQTGLYMRWKLRRRLNKLKELVEKIEAKQKFTTAFDEMEEYLNRFAQLNVPQEKVESLRQRLYEIKQRQIVEDVQLTNEQTIELRTMLNQIKTLVEDREARNKNHF